MTDLYDRLAELARTERRALSAVARAEGLTPEEAVECVQDALVTLLGRPDEGSPLLAALKVTVRNAARNARRRHGRSRTHLPIDVGCEPEGHVPDAESLLAHAEDVARLRVCVAELCSIQRAAVLLRFLEERSGEDAAESLGITRAHLDVLVHRAKASLRVCMRLEPR